MEMFEREGHFWVSFVGTRGGRWVEAANAISAKQIFAIQEGVVMSGYIKCSKKGQTP